MKKHLDFSFGALEGICLTVFILAIPGIVYLPAKFGYENGLLENIQIAILLLSCCFAFKSKENKTFFNFILLVLGILILREINCGRTLFFPIPGQENAFYSWKDIKHGYLAHPLFGIYIAGAVLYGLWNKFYDNLWMFLTKTKLPVWNIIFFIIGLTLSLIAEKMTHNFLFEEFSELLMYIALLGLIKKYSQVEYKTVE